MQAVATGFSIKMVVAVAAAQSVIICATYQQIIAIIATQAVVTGTTIKMVVTVPAV